MKPEDVKRSVNSDHQKKRVKSSAKVSEESEEERVQSENFISSIDVTQGNQVNTSSIAIAKDA